jgi:anaerobic dimethyl sulfoxide reductase subunit A
MIELKAKYGPTALLDQGYAGTSYGVLHKSDQIEGLLSRFLGLFGCRTNSWSVPSYQGTTFSSRITFGNIEDGNEDDAFAHSKLIIMWGWNPAYTFHGGNTFYYMRLAKQKGCKFVVVDPQYTDSAAAYDAWWIPIRPNTDAAMLAGMAHHIFANNLQDQKFIDKFVQGMDAGTMPDWAKGQENFKDYILGTNDKTPKTPEWASMICGVAAADIRKLADMYARTKPAALKASWAPGRNAYGEQYNRMAAAVQAMTGNIGILGGCAEGVGKGWHAESVAYPYDEYANVWYASIKSDRWAHCVLNYPNVKREEIGCWPRDDALDGTIPNIKAIFWHGSDWFNQLTNINKEIEAIKKLELVVCSDSTITPSGCGPTCCCRSPPTSNATMSRCPGTRATTTSIGPRSSSRWASRRPTCRCIPSCAIASKPSTRRLSRASASATTPRPSATTSTTGSGGRGLPGRLVEEGAIHQGSRWAGRNSSAAGVYKFVFDKPHVAFREQIEQGEPFETPSGRSRSSPPRWPGQGLDQDSVWLPDSGDPEVDRALRVAGRRAEGKETSLPPDHAASALAHPQIFHNIPWLRETYQQEVTINASDAGRLGIRHRRHRRGLERTRQGGGAGLRDRALHAGRARALRGRLDGPRQEGVDRSGNPDFLTKDEPSPAGAFAYNTILASIRKKTTLEHRPGWDARRRRAPTFSDGTIEDALMTKKLDMKKSRSR